MQDTHSPDDQRTLTMSTTGKKSSETHGDDDDVLSLREFCASTLPSPSPSDNDPPILITWHSPLSPPNPQHWSPARKWTIVAVSSALTFLSVASSATMAPDLTRIGAALGIDPGDSSAHAMLLSVFLLSGAVGPLAFAPLSEVVGRLPVLHASSLLFGVFNLACAHARTPAQMLAFRFFAGFGSSAMAALASGILADCFEERNRGLAMGVFMIGPNLGPALGMVPLVARKAVVDGV
jgi:hypothetical protein